MCHGCHLHVTVVADVVASDHLVAVDLKKKHVSVEGGREEGERAATAVVHSENRKMVRPVAAVEVGEVGSNPGQNLPPFLRGIHGGVIGEMNTCPRGNQVVRGLRVVLR